MDFSAGWQASSRTLFLVAGVMLLAGPVACGGLGERPDSVDAPVAPVWQPDLTFSSCEQYANTAVGSYLISSDYWNQETCPGTQCIEVNKVTGAFVVTEAPPPCGDDVASFPNVQYGCAYANCSPATMLPLPVSELATVSSSWDWAVGGGSKDRWNVAYELWFCPDNNCGAIGFPGGFELMIWLDTKNARGWKDHLGTAKLSGHSWDVWLGDMAAGGALESWGYMDYILKSEHVTSVTDLDLNAFIQDVVARGYIGSTWYLYAIQAGMEVRSGGMPFISNQFSVSINGVTPSHAPIESAGLSCDAGAPTADGELSVNGTYVTAGPLHGYATNWVSTGVEGSTAEACATPVCTGGQNGEPGTCSPAFGPTALCTTGGIEADSTYHATAGMGFMLNQDPVAAVDAAAIDGGAIPTVGSITIPNTVAVNLVKSGNLTGNNSMRLQLVDVEGKLFCYGGALNAPVPITKFNTACWNNTGDFATPSTLFTRLDVIVPSSAAIQQDFSYCLTSVSVQ